MVVAGLAMQAPSQPAFCEQYALGPQSLASTVHPVPTLKGLVVVKQMPSQGWIGVQTELVGQPSVVSS